VIISRRLVLAGIGSTPIAAALPSLVPLSRQELHVVTADDMHIHVRELQPGSSGKGRPLLLIHGARVPGLASFDLDVPNGSLAGDLGERLNKRVYVMDARGYGGSDRPAAMEKPAAENRPFARAPFGYGGSGAPRSVEPCDWCLRAIQWRAGNQLDRVDFPQNGRSPSSAI
jgi:pimeloyl-ACP methyl ester carboxylesterase